MPKHTLMQRIQRLLSDACADPTLDVAARWEKIAEDFPEVAAAVGPIPLVTLDDVLLEQALPYAGRDADATLRVYRHLNDEIDRMGLRQALELDEAVVPMIARMQQNGMLVDLDHIAVLAEVFQLTLCDLEQRCHTLFGQEFNVGSADQVAEVLFGELGLGGRRKTASGKRYSTEEKALEALRGSHPIVSLIQEHRKVSKLKGTYVDVLPTVLSPDGRIRMELGLTTVPSGRLNCWGGVNLLAIPVRTALGREIRRAFIAPPGKVLCSIDLNQIELRWLAILSGDERLLDAYACDLDLHRLTAAETIYHKSADAITFEQRQNGKIVNFAIANQISAQGLADQFMLSGVQIDEAGCQRILDKWYEFYNAVDPWYQSVYDEGKRNGYIRDGLSGRILYVPSLRSPIDRVRAEAERVATNWKIQTAAQVTIKMGMVALWDWGSNAWDWLEPLLQVHDELLFEVPDSAKENGVGDALREIVEEAAPKTSVPIKAGWALGPNWAELKG